MSDFEAREVGESAGTNGALDANVRSARRLRIVAFVGIFLLVISVLLWPPGDPIAGLGSGLLAAGALIQAVNSIEERSAAIRKMAGEVVRERFPEILSHVEAMDVSQDDKKRELKRRLKDLQPTIIRAYDWDVIGWIIVLCGALFSAHSVWS